MTETLKVTATYNGLPVPYQAYKEPVPAVFPQPERCRKCGEPPVHDIEDPDGQLGGLWCDDCFAEALYDALPSCQGCGERKELKNVEDAGGRLSGFWCAACLLEAIDEETLPKCQRCAANRNLTRLDDQKGVLNGWFCGYCSRILVHMSLLAETNANAAKYLAAFSRMKALFPPGSQLVEKVNAEVRQMVSR
jgi:hypothetical protein